MPRILRIKCNGPVPHINEVDLDKLLTPCFVFRRDTPCAGLSRRLVLECTECRVGKVIITPEMATED